MGELATHISHTLYLEAAIKAFRGMDGVLSPQQIQDAKKQARLNQAEIDSVWERIEFLKQIRK